MMKKLTLSIVAFLAFAATATAQSKLTVIENPVAPTSFAEANVTLADGESAVWFIAPTPTKTVESATSVYFNGPAGDYQVAAVVFSVTGNKVITKKYTTKVTIGSPAPPAPVTPVGPASFLQDAFTKDADATSASKLASVYRMSGPAVDAATSYADLLATMHKAAGLLIPDTAVPTIRTTIKTRLNQSLQGTFDKAKAKAEFAAIAQALDSCK